MTAQLYDIVGSDKGMRVTCGDTAEGVIRYVEKRIEKYLCSKQRLYQKTDMLLLMPLKQ